MGKKNRPTEEKAQPQTGAAGESATRVEYEAHDDSPEMPELWGLGVSKVPGGYLAYKLSNLGKVEILSPRRKGQFAPESQHSAVARMMDAQRVAVMKLARGG